MTGILVLQIIASFLVGGGLITVLSLIAERANEKIAGVILMFPTTITVGYFFLGITTSAEKVATVIPATLIPLGVVVFCSVVYISIARIYSRYIKSKVPQIIASFATSCLIWFVLASPFAIWKWNNLVIGIIGYLVLTLITHILLNREKSQVVAKLRYNKLQIFFRAIFVGTILAIVVLLGRTLDAFWGGIFTMFPAATFATLVIYHFYYEPSQLVVFMKRTPLGSLSLFVYAIMAMLLFPRMGVIFGTVAAYLVSALFSMLMITYQRRAG